MQAKKESVSGRLYIMSSYSVGLLPGMRPTQRSKRKQKQTEAKRLINQMQRKYYLMQLFGVNFSAGKDLFVELSFRHEPTEKEERRAIERFHRRMNNYFEKRGRQYKYILVRETHDRDGQPVRAHYHLVCTGTGKLMREVIEKYWDIGSCDVRALREVSDNFEDTCDYLLKERKREHERAYRCSRNLKKPDEPLRRKVPERERGEVPPGAEIVEHYQSNKDFGRYEIMVCKIVDQNAFDKYWASVRLKARQQAAHATWERYARQRKRQMQK